jgi:hypothetical protein
MSSLAADGALLDRTAAVPVWPAWAHPSGTGQPVGPVTTDKRVLITLIADVYCILSGATLADRLLLLGDATSSRPPLILQQPQTGLAEVKTATLGSQTSAQAAVDKIRAISGLTNEQVAPLAGVSRRSLQAWIAGEPISARKEQRLCALRDALQELGDADPNITRDRLFHRVPGNVRPYDLFVEGRFDEAIDLAMGRHRPSPTTGATRAHDLYAQLSHVEDHVDLPIERLDRRLSRRLR